MSVVLCECTGKLIPFRQLSSTAARAEKGEDSFLKWVLLLIPATTFGLGTWQVAHPLCPAQLLKLDLSLLFCRWLDVYFSVKVKRRQWKMDLINELSRLTTAEPIPLPLEQVHIFCLWFEPHRSTFTCVGLKNLLCISVSNMYSISAHFGPNPSWISVLTSWTTWSTDECGSAAASTTHRSCTSCPARWSTRRGRPGRLEACRPAERPAPMSSPHFTARTSGKKAEQMWCSWLVLTRLITDNSLCFVKHHNPGEQRICPAAEDKTRDQVEGTGGHLHKKKKSNVFS